MDDALESFLTRFAAGAGSQYRWGFLVESAEAHEEKSRRSLRTYVETPRGLLQEMCPISAQATYEFGCIYQTSDTRGAVKQQKLAWPWLANAIIRAADEDIDMDPEIRTRLLRICGLQED